MIAENKYWYCLSTKSKHEQKACLFIQNMGCDWLIPLVKRVSENNKQKIEPLIPSYVFA